MTIQLSENREIRVVVDLSEEELTQLQAGQGIQAEGMMNATLYRVAVLKKVDEATSEEAPLESLPPTEVADGQQS